jgi:hypothetical protein
MQGWDGGCKSIIPHNSSPFITIPDGLDNTPTYPIMPTHSAVATVGLKKPLAIVQVPTVKPIREQVRLRVEWTASTPLDLHQNDGGLLVKHPQVLGDSAAGTVVEVGPDAKRLKVGDQVFGFTWRAPTEKAHQEFCTTEEWLLAKVCRLSFGLTLESPDKCSSCQKTIHWPKQ